jgi:hypothetical protein
MNGIALAGWTGKWVHGSVVFNTIIPSLCIKKKHNSTSQFPQDKRIGGE